MAARQRIFQAFPQKLKTNVPCCDWVGENGAGHYVKMVHNGIEYGDMQLILRGLQHFEKRPRPGRAGNARGFLPNGTKANLDSYLIEIFPRHSRLQRHRRRAAAVDKILDNRRTKGTGKMDGANSADLGIPITLMAEAVIPAAFPR